PVRNLIPMPSLDHRSPSSRSVIVPWWGAKVAGRPRERRSTPGRGSIQTMQPEAESHEPSRHDKPHHGFSVEVWVEEADDTSRSITGEGSKSLAAEGLR